MPDCTPFLPINTTRATQCTTTADAHWRDDTCDASCLSGYTGASVTFTCNADAEWEPAVPFACTPVDCGTPSSVSYPNFDVNGCTSTSYPDTCELECAEGFSPSFTGTIAIGCQASGQWTGLPTEPVPSCDPITCDSTIPPQGEGSTSNCASTSYDAVSWRVCF